MPIGVKSSRVPTEVDYGTKFYAKPTPDKLKNMGDVEKDVSGIIDRNKYWKLKIKKWKSKLLIRFQCLKL